MTDKIEQAFAKATAEIDSITSRVSEPTRNTTLLLLQIIRNITTTTTQQ